MIQEFITKLSKCTIQFNTPVENIYNKNTEGFENTTNNLSIYLQKMLILKPKYLLVGEAPGHKGCRWSGIPFVSERILKENAFFGLENGYKIRDIKKPQTENSATIVWETLDNFGIYPLIWNAFPFHPYKTNDKNSNRTPTKQELEYGRQILLDLLNIFEFEPCNIIAVGKQAKKSLSYFSEFSNIKEIRHPANGGKQEFVKGIQKLY